MISLRGVTKIYTVGNQRVAALNGVDVEIKDGEFLSIMGPSGSGKSTLMNIVGCLDRQTEGEYFLDGLDVSRLGDNQLAILRNRRLGFVFQSFNLLPRISAIEQVALPLLYRGATNRKKAAAAALNLVGLADRAHHKPTQLSGGQQQRVAIARALVTRPSIILADEPTGALDSKTSMDVMKVFRSLNEELGITVAFVTHEQDVAEYTRRVISLLDGKVVGDTEHVPSFEREAQPVAEATHATQAEAASSEASS
jgi:putative ABC transport system ATP-binding protein